MSSSTVQGYAHIYYRGGTHYTHMETVDPKSTWVFRAGSFDPKMKPTSYFVENSYIRVNNDAGTQDAATHYPKSKTNVVMELKSDGKVTEVARRNLAIPPNKCNIL